MEEKLEYLTLKYKMILMNMTKKLKEVKLLVLQSFLQFNTILMKIKSNSSNRQWLNLDKTIIRYKG